MAKREKKPDPIPREKDVAGALFLELMMQMLAFFILLTSMAVIVEDKRLAALGSLAGTFSPLARGANLSQGKGPSLPTRDIVEGTKAPKRTAKALTDVARELGLENAIHVLPLDKETVRVRLPEKIIFATGQTTLSPSADPLMDALGKLFARPEIIEISIEGHTDETPTKGALYTSNWELSAARGMSVFKALSSRGIARSRMIVAGMGDQHPLIENGRDLSRRVEITIKFRPVTAKKEQSVKPALHLPSRPAVAPPVHP